MGALIFSALFVLFIVIARRLILIIIIILLSAAIAGLLVLEQNYGVEVSTIAAVAAAIILSMVIFPLLPHTSFGHLIKKADDDSSNITKVWNETVEKRLKTIEKFLQERQEYASQETKMESDNLNEKPIFIPAQSINDYKIFCPECDKSISVLNKRCPFCKYLIGRENFKLVSCPNCDKERENPSIKFCPNCGEEF
ncbi:hypothetical protein JW887_03655 [Candidatus Dojkabacteria bacterium]|nr:hypothetical protein [Candidatus Dojkabacteria bacterium]